MAESKIKCVLTRKFWDRDEAYLRAHTTPLIEFIIPPAYRPPDLIEASSRGVDILLGDVPVAEVLDAINGVKLLQIPWTGIDNIDFDLLQKFDFQVCNSHSNAVSVAELGVALLLSCIKQIPSHHLAMQQGNWRRPGAADCEMPALLHGKTIGLVGYGAIGRRIGRMVKGFEVKTIALASKARRAEDIDVLGTEQIDLLCQQCDALVISAPLTPKTNGMIGSRQFQMMKSSAYLINISRAAVVDEKALYHALINKRIAGAGIDVWYRYPKRGQSISPASDLSFETLTNVIMSPHRGGMIEGELPHLVDVVENLNRFALGKPLINRVDLFKKY
jgi:phosphoglycerate dehydrogenase-like enzyme